MTAPEAAANLTRRLQFRVGAPLQLFFESAAGGAAAGGGSGGGGQATRARGQNGEGQAAEAARHQQQEQQQQQLERALRRRGGGSAAAAAPPQEPAAAAPAPTAPATGGAPLESFTALAEPLPPNVHLLTFMLAPPTAVGAARLVLGDASPGPVEYILLRLVRARDLHGRCPSAPVLLVNPPLAAAGAFIPPRLKSNQQPKAALTSCATRE